MRNFVQETCGFHSVLQDVALHTGSYEQSCLSERSLLLTHPGSDRKVPHLLSHRLYPCSDNTAAVTHGPKENDHHVRVFSLLVELDYQVITKSPLCAEPE